MQKNDLWQVLSHHVNSFVDDDILDLVHLNERGGLSARGVTGGHLNAQGANDQQGLVVYLHKVDVKCHANQGDEDGTGQDSCVLQNRERAHMETSLEEFRSILHHIKQMGILIYMHLLYQTNT